MIQKEIGEYLLAEKPEGITGLLTLTAVDVSPDLEHAKIYISCLGQDNGEVLKILREHIYEIQGVLYKHLKMKKVPRIHFLSDASGQHAGRINEVLKDLTHGYPDPQ